MADKRPICTCDKYPFPHRIGGKCKGQAFAEFHFYTVGTACEGCNCYNESDNVHQCDVVTGQEGIKYAECYSEACHSAPSEHLQLSWKEYD